MWATCLWYMQADMVYFYTGHPKLNSPKLKTNPMILTRDVLMHTGGVWVGIVDTIYIL